MSNFRLKQPECVLIHIPKTGGSSIRLGIWNRRYDGPVFGTIPSEWNGLFKFAFVRHPFDRLVSAWADFRQIRGSTLSLTEFLNIVMDDSIPFDFLSTPTIEAEIRHHTVPQTHPFNCLSAADFVGRYENYLHDLQDVLNRVGIGDIQDIPSLRKTEHGDWSKHLTSPDDLHRAASFYEEDFSLLGYQIPTFALQTR